MPLDLNVYLHLSLQVDPVGNAGRVMRTLAGHLGMHEHLASQEPKSEDDSTPSSSETPSKKAEDELKSIMNSLSHYDLNFVLYRCAVEEKADGGVCPVCVRE